MEEHPIPQNVTSFEFHLVGDMTLKQFGYLAAGAAASYLLFVFLFPINSYIALPLIAFFFLSGAAFAFLPISDRPLDHWVRAFLQAVYSPTQGSWKPVYLGKSRPSPQDPTFNNRLQIYLNSLTGAYPPTPSPVLPLPATPLPSSPAPSPAPSKLPTQEDLNKLVEMAQQVQSLKKRVAETESELARLKSAPPTAPTHIDERQLKSLTGNLEGLITQAKDTYQKTVKAAKEKEESPAPEKEQRVLVVSTPSPTEKQPQLTSTPNVINGVVTDSSGNLLEGVIAIIHDKNGLPVRALKTNKLGQFTGSTPLPAGIYTLNLEKEGLTFDTFQIDLNGEVLPPLKIVSRKGGV